MATKKNTTNVVDITTAIEETKKVIKKVKASSKSLYPKVVEGSHLKVYTYEDGSTKLEWDDEQLLKEVREAIASVEKKVKPAVKAKSKKKVPEAMKREPAKKTKTKKQ